MRLEAYRPTPENDLLLLKWWERMIQLDELATTFGRGAFTLSTFYSLFRMPKQLLFAEEDNIMQAAVTVEIALNGAYVGLWVAPERRHSRLVVSWLETVYEHLFDVAPVLLGVTRQERLLPAHTKWGYTVVGMIPHLFDGQDAWLVQITKDAYVAAKNRRHHWRQSERAA